MLTVDMLQYTINIFKQTNGRDPTSMELELFKFSVKAGLEIAAQNVNNSLMPLTAQIPTQLNIQAQPSLLIPNTTPISQGQPIIGQGYPMAPQQCLPNPYYQQVYIPPSTISTNDFALDLYNNYVDLYNSVNKPYGIKLDKIPLKYGCCNCAAAFLVVKNSTCKQVGIMIWWLFYSLFFIFFNLFSFAIAFPILVIASHAI